MAIPRPVTKTKIATVSWGIPITDEVNRMTPLVDASTTDVTAIKSWQQGFANGRQVGPGGNHTSGQTIISTTIPAVPVARLLIATASFWLGSTGSVDLQFHVAGSNRGTWRIPATTTGFMLNMTINQSIAANVSCVVSVIAANTSATVTTYADPAFNTIQWTTFPAAP